MSENDDKRDDSYDIIEYWTKKSKRRMNRNISRDLPAIDMHDRPRSEAVTEILERLERIIDEPFDETLIPFRVIYGGSHWAKEMARRVVVSKRFRIREDMNAMRRSFIVEHNIEYDLRLTPLSKEERAIQHMKDLEKIRVMDAKDLDRQRSYSPIMESLIIPDEQTYGGSNQMMQERTDEWNSEIDLDDSCSWDLAQNRHDSRTHYGYWDRDADMDGNKIEVGDIVITHPAIWNSPGHGHGSHRALSTQYQLGAYGEKVEVSPRSGIYEIDRELQRKLGYFESPTNKAAFIVIGKKLGFTREWDYEDYEEHGYEPPEEYEVIVRPQLDIRRKLWIPFWAVKKLNVEPE